MSCSRNRKKHSHLTIATLSEAKGPSMRCDCACDLQAREMTVTLSEAKGLSDRKR